jgi:hypothetical protein
LSGALKDNIHASCAKAFQCKSAYDPTMHNGQFEDNYGTSASQCYDRIYGFVLFLNPRLFDELDASVKAGRIVYNADDYGVCVSAASAESCDAFFGQNGADPGEEPPECQTWRVPQVKLGGVCTIDSDCTTDNCDSDTKRCVE